METHQGLVNLGCKIATGGHKRLPSWEQGSKTSAVPGTRGTKISACRGNSDMKEVPVVGNSDMKEVPDVASSVKK